MRTIPVLGKPELAVAVDRRNVFVNIADKNVLTVIDAKKRAKAGKVKQTLPIGNDCDPVAFDPKAQIVLASNGEGNLTVVGWGAGAYPVVQTLATQPGSKTMALDPSSQRIYLPAARFDGPPTQKPRPKVVPGSFEVWVISEPANPRHS